jgi:hypothetical protein
MNARELDSASESLELKRVRMRDGAVVAVACGTLAVATGPFSLDVALALLAGGFVAVAVAVANLLGRRDAIGQLALDPSAYELPEIRRYGTRLTLPSERAKLAAWLREVVREAPEPGNSYLADRVSRYSGQLESLARQLTASWVLVMPASAVACHRLLTHAAESPLYNPDLPADELPAAIDRICRGITG